MKTTPYANSLFEQPWWLDIVAPGQWDEVVIKDNDRTIARLPYVLNKNNICMPPLTQTLGPWIDPEYRAVCAGNKQLSKQKEIVYELIDQLPKHKTFNMTFDSANEYILPYRWKGFNYTPEFSYRISDLTDWEKIYNNFNKTAKKNIKRAEKICQIVTDLDYEKLYAAMTKTFEKQNRKYPFSKELIRSICETSIEGGHGKIFTAIDDEDRVHASSFMVFDEKCAYDLLGGTDPALSTSGAKSLLWREAISYATTVSEAFDFEGSNIESIENFVRQFGGSRVINYNVKKQGLIGDFVDILKPRIKRAIGYKI